MRREDYILDTDAALEMQEGDKQLRIITYYLKCFTQIVITINIRQVTKSGLEKYWSPSRCHSRGAELGSWRSSLLGFVPTLNFSKPKGMKSF